MAKTAKQISNVRAKAKGQVSAGDQRQQKLESNSIANITPLNLRQGLPSRLITSPRRIREDKNRL